MCDKPPEEAKGSSSGLPTASGATSNVDLSSIASELVSQAITVVKTEITSKCPVPPPAGTTDAVGAICAPNKVNGPETNVPLDKGKEELENTKHGIKIDSQPQFFQSAPNSVQSTAIPPTAQDSSVSVMLNPRPDISECPSHIPSKEQIRKMSYPAAESDTSFMDLNYHQLKDANAKSDVHRNMTTFPSTATTVFPQSSCVSSQASVTGPASKRVGGKEYPPITAKARQSIRAHLIDIQDRINAIKTELAEFGVEMSDPPSRK